MTKAFRLCPILAPLIFIRVSECWPQLCHRTLDLLHTFEPVCVFSVKPRPPWTGSRSAADTWLRLCSWPLTRDQLMNMVTPPWLRRLWTRRVTMLSCSLNTWRRRSLQEDVHLCPTIKAWRDKSNSLNVLSQQCPHVDSDQLMFVMRVPRFLHRARSREPLSFFWNTFYSSSAFY